MSRWLLVSQDGQMEVFETEAAALGRAADLGIVWCVRPMPKHLRLPNDG